MFAHPVRRGLATGATLAVALGGLALFTSPAEAIPPALGSCDATADSPTQTITLNANCDTFTVLTVPDGWTLDGAGHQIVAVQDVSHPSFQGPVLASASGDDTDPATMNVQDLTITSRGFDQFTQDVDGHPAIGISMVRAGGTLRDVTVDGIAHNAPGQLTRAIFVDNQDAGSNDVPRADVTLDRVTTTRFQKSGLFLRGNLGFVVTHATVGQSENVDGTRNLQNASNGIVAIDGAHGSITDSTVGENRYPGDDGGAYEDVTTATGILLQNVTSATLSRNRIEGTDGDTGITVANYTNNINSDVTISCSTLISHDGGHTDENLGFGIWNYEGNNPGSVDLTVASNTFSGWRQDVQGDATEETDPSCSTNNTLTASDTQVVSNSSTKLSGVVTDSDGSPVAGSASLQRREGTSGSWTVVRSTPVASNGRYAFTVAPDQLTQYRTRFTGEMLTPSTSKAVTIRVAPRVSIGATRTNSGPQVTLTFKGTVSPRLTGRSTVLQQKVNGTWTDKRDTVLDSDGGYSFTWKTTRGTHDRSFRVVTEATPQYAGGTSRVLEFGNLS